MKKIVHSEKSLANRRRRKRTGLEDSLWDYIRDYSATWVFPDNPSRWSAKISRLAGYGPGWLASLRARGTSAPISSIVVVCDVLNKNRPRSAPPLTPAIAFLGAERRLGDTQNALLSVTMSLSHQIRLGREARERGQSLEEFTKNILTDYLERLAAKDE